MTKQLLATALAAVLMLAAAAPTAAEHYGSTDPTTETPCAAMCTVFDEGGTEICLFEVSRDNYAGALGYYTFSGRDGDCGGTNPVLGTSYTIDIDIYTRMDSYPMLRSIGPRTERNEIQVTN